jgi:hypothetical protein
MEDEQHKPAERATEGTEPGAIATGCGHSSPRTLNRPLHGLGL